MQQEQRTKRGMRPAKAAEKLGVSIPTLWRYARTNPDFPKPTKLSEHVTIFDEDELDAWIASRKRITAPRKMIQSDGKAKDAAAVLGCRLVGDLSAEESKAWSAAGKPQRVQLGEYELVPLKALQRLSARTSALADDLASSKPRRKHAPAAAEPATA